MRLINFITLPPPKNPEILWAGCCVSYRLQQKNRCFLSMAAGNRRIESNRHATLSYSVWWQEKSPKHVGPPKRLSPFFPWLYQSSHKPFLFALCDWNSLSVCFEQQQNCVLGQVIHIPCLLKMCPKGWIKICKKSIYSSLGRTAKKINRYTSSHKQEVLKHPRGPGTR